MPMTESVSDVLESYDLEEKVDDALDLIHEASDTGISKKNATPTIVVHVIHVNTYKTWAEVCSELGTSPDKLLQHRKELVKAGVIQNEVEKPSTLAQGRPGRLLELAENSHSDRIFDGTSPNSWVAGAAYLDEWINLRETPKVEVARRYGCNPETVSEMAGRLVRLDVFPRAYATEDIDGPLGHILARRRHSTESLRLSLSETTRGVKERLRDLERKGKWQLHNTEFGGTTFYWTTD